MKYLRGISLLVFLIPSLLYAEEDYWAKLNKKANELFRGWDVTITVNTGVEHREYFQGTHTGPYGNIEISVPLYSKDERIKKARDKIEYLKQGAELIRIIEERQARIEIKKKQAQILKAIMMDEGAASIKAYYDVVEEMAKMEAEIDEAKKRLEAMLK